MKKNLFFGNGAAKAFRRFAALLLTSTVVLLTLCLASCGKTEPTAQEYLDKALEKSFSAEDQTIAGIGDKVYANIVWNATPDTEALGIDALSMKVYSSAATAAMELDLEMMGSALALKEYIDESSLVLAFETDALGNTVYGVDLTKLEQSYGDSIFADPDSPYYIGGLSELSSTLLPTVDSNAIAERYVTALTNAADDNGKATLSDRDGGGKSVSFSFDNAGIKGVIRACYDLMKDDAELRELLAMYVSSAEDGEDFLEGFDAFFASEEDLNELLAEFDEGSYEATLEVLTDEKDMIEKATLALRYTDEETTDSIELSLDLSEGNAFKLSLEIETADGEGQTSYYQGFALTFKEKRTVGGAQNIVVTLDVMQSSSMKVSLELLNATYHKNNGNFSVTLLRGIPDVDTIKLEGQMTVAEDAFSLSVTELSVGTTVMAVDLSLSISAIDAIPEAPAYTDVLSLTDSQMDAIGEALMSHPIFSQLFSN